LDGFPDDARFGRVPVVEHRVLSYTVFNVQSKQLLARLRVAH